ncbi:hypothetical protein BDV96DRAFT_601541 [Lophiotrema nucula]|uniref:Uncharacterized protein n=1 Tax=Lophiotrema nucula TaxID=690887 RepID=A0A6A5Z3B4_9PLEO|nr:hypothetical protein BDV96DRAFT_601541 [Lophiotrema nucula]
MGWWRRDPSLWCRSPLHRYSRLGDRTDALLRSRCFSKSQARAAQHKDDDDARRPDDLSDLQWIQLQHYRRWKRRLQENPYRALFGASEDMLNGKGLKDWEWVSKAFPKWMLRDMGIDEWGGQGRFRKGRTVEGKPTSDPPTPPKTQKDKTPFVANDYPKKVDISTDSSTKTRAVMPTWKEVYDKYSAGVASPSDTRRPAETAPTRDALIDDLFGHRSRKTPPRMDSHGKQETKAVAEAQGAKETSIEAAKRETTFIKEFLDDTPKAIMNTEDKSNTWRQTSIDRRAEPGFVPQMRKSSIPPTPPSSPTDEVSKPKAVPETRSESSGSEDPVMYFHVSQLNAFGPQSLAVNTPSPIPSSQPSGDHQVKPSDLVTHAKPDHIKYDTDRGIKAIGMEIYPQLDELESRPALSTTESNDQAEAIGRFTSKASRSTSETLSQLPKDDLDFLSAEEIRASMGVKQSAMKSAEEKRQARKELEEEFKKSQEEELKLDAMIEAKIINDQVVRRTERLLHDEVARDNGANKTEQPVTSRSEAKVADAESAIETSIDRMTKWLKTSGDAINRNFWQEPSQKAQVDASSDSFLKGIVSGVEKSRGTMELVREDLAKDLPCSKPLLQRLQDNEASIIPRAGKLARYQQNAVALHSALRARGRVTDRVKQLRTAFNLTEKEFETASKELEMTRFEVMYPSEKRLQKAFEILQKNVRLSRRMFFGLQARLESTGSAPLTPMYIDMGHRLLALRDTQFAILRLVERAIHTYNMKAEPGFRSNSYGVFNWDDVLKNVDTFQPDDVRASQQLNNEVEAQKSAMQGLSDDGYSRVPKPAKKTTFAAESPLAHSLFRPFTQQFEALGKEEVKSKSAEDPAIAKSRQDAEDRALVKEVKKAYEDNYGPITVHHRQVLEEEHPEAPGELSTARFPEVIAPEESEKMAGTLQDLARQGLLTVNVDPPASARVEETATVDQPPAYTAVTESETPPSSDTTSSVPSQESNSTSASRTESVTEPDTTASVAEVPSQSEARNDGPTPLSGNMPLNREDLLFRDPNCHHPDFPRFYWSETLGEWVSAAKTQDQPGSYSDKTVEENSGFYWSESLGEYVSVAKTQDQPTSTFRDPNHDQPGFYSNEKVEGNASTAKTQDQPPRTFRDPNWTETGFIPPPTPVTYTVLTYNPTTDEISVITTTSSTPEDSSDSIPISKAFRRLEYPAKFLPHLPQGFNITAVSKHSLILRESDDPSTVIRSITTHPETDNRDDDFKHTVNPVDGTARLSPTGYVGVDDLKEEVGRELDAIRRREAAERIFKQGKADMQLREKLKDAEKRREKIEKWKREKMEKRKKGSVLGSVLKTAIVGGTICYIFGVIGEIAS